MKNFIVFLLISKASFLFSQNTHDTIQPPIYDTTSIDIRSTNSFYFCSKLFKIPRTCDTKDQGNCCSFTSHISKFDKITSNGQIGCNNGTTLYWTTFETENIAKMNFESSLSSMKKQMKKFEQEEVKFFVCDKEVKAKRQIYTSQQGYDFIEYIFYGTINGQSILGRLMVHNKEKSSSELTQLFQQLVRF